MKLETDPPEQTFWISLSFCLNHHIKICLLVGRHHWAPSTWHPFVLVWPSPCLVDNFVQLTFLSIVIFSRYFALPAKREFSLLPVYRLTPPSTWQWVVKFPVFTSVVCSNLIYHSKSVLQTEKKKQKKIWAMQGVKKELVGSFQEGPQRASPLDIHTLV